MHYLKQIACTYSQLNRRHINIHSLHRDLASNSEYKKKPLLYAVPSQMIIIIIGLLAG